jgi:hypothetical protein
MKARLFALLLLALPALAPAQYKPWYNFNNFAYGAKARSMGNAFTAVADDLTAVFWNPAGLAARRSPEFYLGYKASSQWHDYDLQDNGVLGEESRLYNFNFASRLNQIDFFAVSAPATLLGQPSAFTLGYYRYIPYGFKGSAREVLTFLRNRNEPRRGTMTFAGSEGFDVLAFSAAVDLTSYFSLGATLQQFFGSGFISFDRVSKVGEEVIGGSQRQFTEKLQGRNVIVGALFTPFRQLRLGFTWHSGLKGRLDSALTTREIDPGQEGTPTPVETSSQARVAIPDQYALGVLLRPAAWLDLSAEYSRLDWDSAFIEGYYDAAAALPYPQKADWPQAQKRSRNLRFGAEARLPFRSFQLSLRGGWSLDRQLYADSAGKAVAIRGFAGGIGCEFNRKFAVEATYQRQVADWPEQGFFNLSPDVPTHYRANVFFLALTYRFGHIFKE